MQRIRSVALLAALLAPATAAAERPDGWLFRASPGFGYAWDHEPACQVEGRMFVGGFSLGYFVAPGLMVGAATRIQFNTLPDYGCMPSEGGLRFTTGYVLGPGLDWYPLQRGLHLVAIAGYADIEQQMRSTGPGIGGELGVGYDWRVAGNTNDLRLGVLASVTWIATANEHATMTPALLFTVGID